MLIPVSFKPKQLTICKGISLVEVKSWLLLLKESRSPSEKILENTSDPEHLRTRLLGSIVTWTGRTGRDRALPSAIHFPLQTRTVKCDQEEMTGPKDNEVECAKTHSKVTVREQARSLDVQ